MSLRFLNILVSHVLLSAYVESSRKRVLEREPTRPTRPRGWLYAYEARTETNVAEEKIQTTASMIQEQETPQTTTSLTRAKETTQATTPIAPRETTQTPTPTQQTTTTRSTTTTTTAETTTTIAKTLPSTTTTTTTTSTTITTTMPTTTTTTTTMTTTNTTTTTTTPPTTTTTPTTASATATATTTTTTTQTTTATTTATTTTTPPTPTTTTTATTTTPTTTTTAAITTTTTTSTTAAPTTTETTTATTPATTTTTVTATPTTSYTTVAETTTATASVTTSMNPRKDDSESLEPKDQIGCTYCPESPISDNTFQCWQSRDGLNPNNIRTRGTDASVIEDIRTFSNSADLSTELDAQKFTNFLSGSAGKLLSTFLDGKLDFIWRNNHKLLQAKFTIPVRRQIVADPSKLLPAAFLQKVRSAANASATGMDEDEALNFAAQHGTHMVTEILVGGQLILLREVEENDEGIKLPSLLSLHFAGGGLWSHVDVRGGNTSLLNIKLQNKTDDDVVEAIHKWADSVRTQKENQVIIDQTITPLYLVMPWEPVHDRKWLENVIENATYRLRSLRQKRVLISSLADDVSELMKCLKSPENPCNQPPMTRLETISKFVQDNGRLCHSISKAENSSIGILTPYRIFAELCQQAALLAWDTLVPEISRETSHRPLSEISDAMDILRSCGKKLMWHDWQEEQLNVATCNLAKRALFCKHQFSCLLKPIKCIPAKNSKGQDVCKCYHRDARTRSERQITRCDGRYAAIGNDEWNCEKEESDCICHNTFKAQPAQQRASDWNQTDKQPI